MILQPKELNTLKKEILDSASPSMFDIEKLIAHYEAENKTLREAYNRILNQTRSSYGRK